MGHRGEARAGARASDYPVFTRKAMTDLCYLDCVRKLLAARPRLYPQFATHNALTVACVIEDAGDTGGYEFQRLHGMGEALYDALLAELPDLSCRVYAPVGGHADLLAYLVRRLLENGANSSFVSVAADPSVPVETILRRPQSWIGDASHARHSHIPLPRDLFGASRRNSSGVEFGDTAALEALAAEVRSAPKFADAKPLIDGSVVTGVNVRSTLLLMGLLSALCRKAMRLWFHCDGIRTGCFPRRGVDSVAERAAALERAGDLLEQIVAA